ncbi:MAG: cation diffusion facilitator family transporter [Actinobacteria bacterium]|nr:cation diffusion facilitator family transporter [Actinomycetota bacterium]MSZ83956.1 cation diffusion facilitator family transporter [Actinomycetota bacterium]MTB18664.1 cation diffusion facilitator family transporter [Actinomycetota bacterium]
MVPFWRTGSRSLPLGNLAPVQDGSRKAIIAAFFANLGISVAKFVGFLLTGSAGLLAEAGHSVADTGNQGLLMFGSKRGKRPADSAHPFGYGPERYFWSFIVALVLFSMGGLFALYEGISKVQHPHEVESATIAFVILGIAILLESYSLRTAVKEANHVRNGRTWWNFIRTAKAPELPVVLLEDVGAETGLVFALFGLTMSEVTGNPRWDAVGSIAIGALLVGIAIVLAVEMKGLLIGESASDEDLVAVKVALSTTPRVLGIIHLRTMHLGPDQLLVAAKLEFDHSLTVAQLAQAIDDAEQQLRAAVPIARTIYIEPDIRRQPQE